MSDMDWDGWLWHQFFFLFTSGAIVSHSSQNFLRLPIDSKAMRKLRVNDTVAIVGEFTESGNAAMEVNADSRILLKLP